MPDISIITQDGFPYGVRCCGCNRIIQNGQIYASVFDGVTDDGYLIEAIYCHACEGFSPPTPEEKWAIVEARAKARWLANPKRDWKKWERQLLFNFFWVAMTGDHQ